MPELLNNVTTADTYVDTATATFPLAAAKVNLIVANNAVYVSFMRETGRNPSGTWTIEEYLVPGAYSRTLPDGGRAVRGVRMRSATAGKPAQVSARGV